MLWLGLVQLGRESEFEQSFYSRLINTEYGRRVRDASEEIMPSRYKAMAPMVFVQTSEAAIQESLCEIQMPT